MKLGRLISSTGNTPTATKKFCSHGKSLFSTPHPLDFDILAIFSSKNIKRGHTLGLTYLYAVWIMHMRHDW